MTVVHELPGLTQETVNFADWLVASGFRVHLPHLFGDLMSGGMLATAGNYLSLCVSAEFARLRAGVSAPVTGWLRNLAAEVSRAAGGGRGGACGAGRCRDHGVALPG